ncbi:MAG: CooT family nickel-binding protein [Proteobacteria bacterium]|jgi:predicted RNA-binding protein|nr:CooT family nickel-binding protein [Pseudomonadota bacterium]
MCESSAYLKKGEKEELILKDVTRVTFSREGWVELENILGEEKKITARLKEINFLEHKLIFE